MSDQSINQIGYRNCTEVLALMPDQASQYLCAAVQAWDSVGDCRELACSGSLCLQDTVGQATGCQEVIRKCRRSSMKYAMLGYVHCLQLGLMVQLLQKLSMG